MPSENVNGFMTLRGMPTGERESLAWVGYVRGAKSGDDQGYGRGRIEREDSYR